MVRIAGKAVRCALLLDDVSSSSVPVPTPLAPVPTPTSTLAPMPTLVPTPAATPTAVEVRVAVTIRSIAFTPSTITTSVGSTVTWTNLDGVSHTVTGNNGAWGSGVLDHGQPYLHDIKSFVPDQSTIERCALIERLMRASRQPPIFRHHRPTMGCIGISSC
jgi:hypothetical protein